MEQMFQLDDYDLMILNELRKNSKQSFGKLAAKIGKPKSFVYRRITKMEAAGIIAKYSIAINYEKIGKPIIAFILISVTPSAGRIPQREIAEQISKIPQVYEIHVITGEYDIIAKIRARSVEELGNVVVNKIRNVEGVAKTLTNVALITLSEEITTNKV